MTTVGVNASQPDRVDALRMPSYTYHYPSFKRVQLAAVKQGMFHPSPPRLRRMDMDNAIHKLSDEHCRNTTTCGPRDFSNATSTPFMPPPQRLHSYDITETGKQVHRQYTTPEELARSRKEWSDFLAKSPERYDIKLPELGSSKDIHFDGYAVRYLRPDITKSWKYTLQQEPKLDQYAQKPVPANIYARYRDTYPQYHRNVASEMWR
ncbi:testis, prostate and placenta-expressed protein [Aplysia californica]|uniref:Testis, prostate and placenta-expressed protein n=1 Tax=Aplysia californica TaxID=6500 RepID=A0ABM1AG55_APLCA|nr:testis, prostate and placenta-expressed protein [Aplysia californica]